MTLLLLRCAAVLSWMVTITGYNLPILFPNALRISDRSSSSLFARALPFAAGRQVQQDGDPIDALVSQLLGTPGAGINVLVTVKGKIVKELAYGIADEENRLPLETSSRTNIGSVSKQFTAFAVLLMEHDGLLSLTDDVRKHIPEMPDYGKTIRLSHLISMTSGIRDDLVLVTLSGASVNWIPRERLLQLITLQERLRFEPGERWEYSNSNYLLLALVVERVAGMPFTEVLAQRIFKPLGMNDTTVYDDPSRIYPRLTQSYTTLPIVPSPGDAIVLETYNAKSLLTAIGATGIITTPSDVLKWARNFDGNVLGGGQALIEEMQSPYIFQNQSDVTYALGGQYSKGLFVRKISNFTVFEHAGTDAGFQSVLFRVPELETTVILQATSNIFGDTVGIAARIAESIHPQTFSLGSEENSTVSEEPYEMEPLPNDIEAESSMPPEFDADAATSTDLRPDRHLSADPFASSPEPSDESMMEEDQAFVELSLSEYAQKAGVWTVKDQSNSHFDMTATCSEADNSRKECALKINLGSFTETFLRPVSELVWVGRVLGVDRALTVTFSVAQPTELNLLLSVPDLEEYKVSAFRNPALQLTAEELRHYEGQFFSKELDAVFNSVATDHGLQFGPEAGIVPSPSYLPCCAESVFNGSFVQARPRPIAGPLLADSADVTLLFSTFNAVDTVSLSISGSSFPRSHFQDIGFRRLQSCSA